MKGLLASKLNTVSLPVILGTIRLIDLFLLLAAGVLATSLVPVSERPYSDDSFVIATTVASAVAALSLKKANAYQQDALLSLTLQAQISIKPLLIGTCGAIIYLFLFYSDFQHVRKWPLVWAGMAAALVGGVRYLEVRLIGHLTKNGRLARKVAVVGVRARPPISESALPLFCGAGILVR